MRALEFLLLTAFIVGNLSSHLSLPVSNAVAAETTSSKVTSSQSACEIKFLSHLGWKIEGGSKNSKVQTDSISKIFLPSDFDSLDDQLKSTLLFETLHSESTAIRYWERVVEVTPSKDALYRHRKVLLNQELISVYIPREMETGTKDFYDELFKISASYWVETANQSLRGWVLSSEQKEVLKTELEKFYLKYPDVRFWNTPELAKGMETHPLFIGIKMDETLSQSLGAYWKKRQEKELHSPLLIEIHPRKVIKKMYESELNRFLKTCLSNP